MDNHSLQKLVNRIASGKVRINNVFVKGRLRTIVVHSPSSDVKSTADDIYLETLNESTALGVYTASECLDLSYELGLWSSDEEKRLEKIPKDMEEMKVLIYQHFAKPSEANSIRRNLRAAESTYFQLLNKKHSLDVLSAESIARKMREHFILARCSFFDYPPKPVFAQNFWLDRRSDSFLLQLVGLINTENVTEKQFRYIAQREPWRSIWVSGKESGRIFESSASEMSEEQRSLICWSKMYDNISECPDKPSDDIVADDDALDGWMITVGRERQKKEKAEAAKNTTRNDKIKNSGEVYIVANTADPASSYYGMNASEAVQEIEANNSDEAKRIKRQRESFIKKRNGVVLEQELPDVKLDLMTQASRAAVQSMKRRG